jgi:hypothetical protein
MARRSVLTDAMVLAAALGACALALLAVPERAEAPFPSVNGGIAFATKACNDHSVGVCPDSEIASMRPDGTDRKPLTDELFDDEYPDFSPDGVRRSPSPGRPSTPRATGTRASGR